MHKHRLSHTFHFDPCNNGHICSNISEDEKSRQMSQQQHCQWLGARLEPYELATIALILLLRDMLRSLGALALWDFACPH